MFGTTATVAQRTSPAGYGVGLPWPQRSTRAPCRVERMFREATERLQEYEYIFIIQIK